MPIPPKPGYAYVFKCPKCQWQDDFLQYSDRLFGPDCCPKCGFRNLQIIQVKAKRSILDLIFGNLMR